MPDEPLLLTLLENSVLTLRLNRPQRRNALSLALLEALDQALADAADRDDVRVIVVASEGPVFSSGHDLGEMQNCSADEYHQLFATCSRVMQRLRQVPQPVMARVQGLATAAGCQLVAACDLAVASEDARFATPGVKIGLFCTTPMVPLVRSIPSKFAMEMLLTGQPIPAKRAFEIGLINAVVPASELDAKVQEFVTTLLASSRHTLALGKRAFYHELPLAEEEAYADAVDVMTRNAQEHDAQEGINAFLQKRPPRWSD